MIYYDYFHAIMNCRITFLENFPCSVEVFKIHNNIIIIITGCKSKYSHRVSLFHRAFFNSIMYKTPTHALYVQYYIILTC